MISVGIITAPRIVTTVFESVKSLRVDAGYMGNIHVFAEPGSEVTVGDHVHIHMNETTKGNFRNWVGALTTLHKTEADWLVLCEDDIKWAHGAWPTLLWDLDRYDRTDGRAGALSLYCPIRMSKVLENKYANGRALTQGWYGAALGRSTWGAQCLVFHKDWAAALLADTLLTRYLNDSRWTKNVDAIAADVINCRGRELVYRIPCLVDHTFGEGNSSLGYKPDRPELKTKYFKDVS